MRTETEILERVNARREMDIFHWELEILAPYLTTEHVRPFCKAGADLSSRERAIIDRAAIVETMRDYMPFAWEKATGHRGLSAGRSVQKFATWLWLVGRDEMVAFAEDERNYPQYGVPVLSYISKAYDFPIPEGADVERMAKGEPCEPACAMGCAE